MAPSDAIERVLDAYRAAGTFLGAARTLNASELRSEHGGAWHPKVVKSIVQRAAPKSLEGELDRTP